MSTGARKAAWVGGMGGHCHGDHRGTLWAAPWGKQYWTCSWTQCAQGKPGISSCLCDRPSSSLSPPALPSLMPAGLYCYGNTMDSPRFSPPALWPFLYLPKSLHPTSAQLAGLQVWNMNGMWISLIKIRESSKSYWHKMGHPSLICTTIVSITIEYISHVWRLQKKSIGKLKRKHEWLERSPL